ncbi:type II secretion system inner membrane protein GspF [Algicola sagamiensis]|uniref:type II secretion system inner membrane protein GspF n=1 Tax=Algicola sagamiensis TaxID=163869 RepID=UPI0003724522|nr:type II secretion system inner membrane protein GspF [Algicola sagamiensis]
MAAFEYKALNAKGKQKKGIIEADTARQVRTQLREQGLMPLEVEVANEKATTAEVGGFSFSFARDIPVSDKALITRQVATLIESGLPIEASLLAVAEQCENPRLKKMMMTVRSKVVEGFSFADGLAEFPHVFDHLYRSMVAAGEKSGHLEAVLNRLADYTEQRAHMRSQMMQAMIYPIVLIVIACAVTYALLVTVVPKIVTQFVQSGQKLPGLTEFVINASNFASNYGVVVLVGFVVLFASWKQVLKKPKVRLWYDHRLITMPMIGKVARGLNTARFARTLSILTASSVPLLEGMRIAGQVLSNEYIKGVVGEAASKVREGASLKASLEQTKIFPPMMLHMIASGEKSGELEQMLDRAANNQDREFETLVNVSLKLFEPLLIVMMAGVVLTIVMAILLPIIEMNNLVGL